MRKSTIELFKQFLFAEEDELDRSPLTEPQRRRIYRVRELYTMALHSPKLSDHDLEDYAMKKYDITRAMAWDDLSFVRLALGSVNKASVDYYRWVFLQRCQEGFQMARENNDASAFARVLAAFGKYTQLDRDESNQPDYSQITPQTFEISADPSVAGYKPIPNLEKKIQKMMRRYTIEEKDVEFEPIEPLRPEIHRNNEEREYD